MNRIDQKFCRLREVHRKAFIAYVMAGDPSLEVTVDLVLAFAKAGVDIVELGVPFSDPLADGPVIQAAAQRAIGNGATLQKVLDCVTRIRQHSDIPLALMTYYNPVFHFGEERFVEAAQAAGVDGVIIPDLPLEEAAGLIKAARPRDLATIFFLSPTTAGARMKKIVAAATGFVYYVSVAGVTGERVELPKDFVQRVRQAQTLSGKPICVGFGVSSPAQVQTVAAIADGVIVGSAIVKRIEQEQGHPDLVARVTAFVRELVQPLSTKEE